MKPASSADAPVLSLATISFRFSSELQRPFRRSLRELMRVTFVATKVTKTAHAAKAPGKLRRFRKLRRVPCVSHIERPVPKSLSSVAQTCGTGMPRSRLRYSAPSRQTGWPPKVRCMFSASAAMQLSRQTMAQGYTFSGTLQSTGVIPCSSNQRLAREKCLHPKNPRWADNGDGCGAVRTRWRLRSIPAPLRCA